jgi:hypothetical protein
MWVKNYTIILFWLRALPLAMELVPKCNSFREIGVINLEFISFENFLGRELRNSRSQFLNVRLVLLGLACKVCCKNYNKLSQALFFLSQLPNPYF